MDKIKNIEYYSTIREIKRPTEKVTNELNKPLANKNEVKKINEIIRELTFKLENVKKVSVLNSNKNDEEIPILNLKRNNEVVINKDKYRNLDEFFNTKISLLEKVDEMLSDENNKETFLTTYQITQLLR